jgi:hypothetical protein
MVEEVIDTKCVGTASVRVRILAYLGELKPGEFVKVRKLINDLDLRFTTAKNALSSLEEDWIVEKRIVNNRGIVASFRIMPTAVMPRKINGVATVNHPDGDYVPFVPPEWESQYGKHPYHS